MQINITFGHFKHNLAQLPNPEMARNETLLTQLKINTLHLQCIPK